MIDKQRVAQLPMPILLLAGENTGRLNKLVNAELERLLPQAQRVTIPDTTHEMWSEQPEACSEAVLQFLQENETA
jgi:pimeloyl-ACP methyl ester carboxylesterase